MLGQMAELSLNRMRKGIQNLLELSGSKAVSHCVPGDRKNKQNKKQIRIQSMLIIYVIRAIRSAPVVRSGGVEVLKRWP